MSLQDLARHDAKNERGVEIPPPRRRWTTRFGLPLLLVVATVGLLVGTGWTALFPGTPVRVTPVMVKTVEAGAGQTSVTASGWLEPEPYTFYAAALAEGIVERVVVLEGQRVKQGEVVAELVTDDAKLALERATAEFDLRESETALARANLDAAQETFESLVDRGAAVDTGKAKVSELEGAMARVDAAIVAAEASLAATTDELERKRELVDSGAVSAGALRRLELRRDAGSAEVDAVRQERKVVSGKLEGARAVLKAAELHKRLLIEERHAVRVAEAALTRAKAAARQAGAARDEAQLRLDRMQVRAPIDGVVLRRLVSPGSRVSVGGGEHSAHVVHLYDPEQLQVRVDVPLADAAAVGVDQAAEVTVQALPDHVFRGRVTRLVHRADIQKNTVEVKVALEKPDGVLKPEMLARVRFLAGAVQLESRQRLLIPERTLEQRDGGAAVWIVVDRVGDQGVAARRSVTLGIAVTGGTGTSERWLEVTSGLQPGDVLIDPAPQGLETGDRVTVLGETSGGGR